MGSEGFQPAPASIPTPTLLLDEARLDRNIAAMAELAASRGLTLRPHAKTHKSIEIARRQVAAGAVGVTVATISEAEVFARAGIPEIFIAYPLWLDVEKAERLGAILELTPVRVGVDSLDAAERLASLPSSAPGRLSVLVEIDCGQHRSGVAAESAGELAAAATGLGLDVAGVFTFPGHSYSPDARRSAAEDEARALSAAVASLGAHGITARIVSGGSTPSIEFADASVLTEIRPGVYVFGDAQQLELGACRPEDIALTVVSTIVSAGPGRVIADAGSKALGADRAAYASGFGRVADAPDARIPALSEHHATITGLDVARGTRVNLVPNHVCAAVNLADDYAVVRDGRVVGRWPVDARGSNR